MATPIDRIRPAAVPDTEPFRLRRFIATLEQLGELDVCEAPTETAAIAQRLEGNRKAVWFKNVGAEQAEVVGNVMGSRSRIAAAFGVGRSDVLSEIRRRLGAPQPLINVDGSSAPVQEEVWVKDEADLTRLPVPFQHAGDGGLYLSSSVDVVLDPATGLHNVGCRRLMLRGRAECGIDLNAPSDLKAIYEDVGQTESAATRQLHSRRASHRSLHGGDAGAGRRVGIDGQTARGTLAAGQVRHERPESAGGCGVHS